MFLDILKFKTGKKTKIMEKLFENVVSEIHDKNLFCPYKPPKIMNAFMVFSF